ncbi:MAG: peptidase C15 [Actinomycetota bacterium]
MRVLITGFGPFPGVPVNPSAWLAEALPERLSQLNGELQARVLPTEWGAVEGLVRHLHETIQPHVTIHFGLSQTAKEFRIERSAYNRASLRRDASGSLPRDGVILAEGADRLDTSLPASALSAHLRQRGVPAAASRSAGRYLCNFLYYLSLARAAGMTRAPAVLFVHIPPLAAHGGPLNEAELLGGAEAIVRFALAHWSIETESLGTHAAPRAAP